MHATVEHLVVEDVSRTGIAVLRIQGRLDADAAQMLIARCSQVQDRGWSLVLNLSGVTFLGSSGVGALLVLSDLFQEQGQAMRLAALSDAASTVVELLELDARLMIDATEKDAVSALGN